MKILSSDRKIGTLAYLSILVGAALLLSYIEAVIPLDFLPLPGFRIGLSNIALTVAAFALSPWCAAAVSLARIILVFLLFGNPTSLLFSLFGSSLVIVMLAVLRNHSHKLSFVGISILCATVHNCGQLIAALLLVGTAVLSYIPFLMLASLLFGSLNGIILNLLPYKIFQLRG